MASSPETSKFGSIRVNIHAPFKRPLIPSSQRVHGWGRRRLGGWGCGRGMLPRPSSLTPPRRSRPAPPTCSYHPTFLSRTAPATGLAVMEVAEHSVLFFVEGMHQIEITKGDSVDAESEIHFAISLVAPPVRPTKRGTSATLP